MVAISLQKGQSTEITEQEVTFQVNWAVGSWAKGKFGMKPKLDLDASAVALTANCDVTGFCFYGFPSAARDSIIYGGDNKASSGKWANETVKVNFPRVPADVTRIAFLLSAFKKADFANLGEAFAQVMKGDNELASASISLVDSANVYLPGMFVREGSGWSFTRIDVGGTIGSGQNDVKAFAQTAVRNFPSHS